MQSHQPNGRIELVPEHHAKAVEADTGPFPEVLTPEALAFVGDLVREFSPRLDVLLRNRMLVHESLRKGVLPDFLEGTRRIRLSDWRIEPIPSDLRTRRVEITGPVDRKMVINALNSGADVYMADFEDSHSPTWEGTIHGQANLRDAVDRTIEYVAPDGREYKLGSEPATLMVRPRGLHLKEKHVLIDSDPVPASLFDYGLFLYHNAKKLIARGTGPYFYIPKLENYQEARFWNDVFQYSENSLDLPHRSIKCSVLVETLLAAFQMEEILYELQARITALNFGRWDYIFSLIKFLGHDHRFIVPERSLLRMTTKFLKSGSQLLVQTCHKRGAFAIGGMAAQIPIKGDPRSEEAIAQVVEDKRRELAEGYEGAWVAHPGLVPIIKNVFDAKLSEPGRDEEDQKITRKDLLDTPRPRISEQALRANVAVSLHYLEAWLGGLGCVAINSLMEDTATVEICRAQIWQWIHHSEKLTNGSTITRELFRTLLNEEISRAKTNVKVESIRDQDYSTAGSLLDTLATGESFPEFMTLLAYDFVS